MKMDKTGACTVIAAIATVARLAPGTPLLAVAPAVENMPGPHSTRPGDIVTAMNGKTVDITNTDAEGRLILGDAMTYAEHLGATHLVDVATLTGAVSRALGHLVTGCVRHAAGLLRPGRRRRRAGRRALLAAPARRRLRHRDGQLVRATSRTPARPRARWSRAALFLREFATRPWVHLDIAGTAYYRKATVVRAEGRDRRVARHARRAGPGRRATGRLRHPSILVTLGPVQPAPRALAGLLLGLASDRLATRWPEHDEDHPPGRHVDWRTGLTALAGALAFGLLPVRFGGDPLALALFGAWFATMIVGLGTDLDQRLLPNLLTCRSSWSHCSTP